MIPGIGSIGGAELLVPLVVVFLFLGVKRFPELERPLGIGVTELDKEVPPPSAHTTEGSRSSVPTIRMARLARTGSDTPSGAGKRTRGARARGGNGV